MRHDLHFTTPCQTRDSGVVSVCEAEVVTTGFQSFGPCLLNELLSMGMTQSEILDTLLMTPLSDSDLEFLLLSLPAAN
ncbi:hypothetical protein [Mesoterricola silvestris]|uniref:Uncharacterized protein n=1 Tax=Mesoterricola silvestris TaxID=2927979 RepID=A0AA48K8Q9_9BACT|nr:hypothetical protein [Mesoterricola silvestris]BDU71542.1 hypothetical protein METEAL_07160 [Mesoterricola silvestris]